MNKSEAPKDYKANIENVAKKSKSRWQEWKFNRNEPDKLKDINLMIEPIFLVSLHVFSISNHLSESGENYSCPFLNKIRF